MTEGVIRRTVLLLLFAVVTGCATGQSVPDQPLLNTYWKLVSLEEPGVTVIEGHREPHLVLHQEGQRLAGSTGCNNLSGRYQLDDDQLRFRNLVTTLIACREVMQQEALFLKALKDTVSWTVDGDVLVFRDERGAKVAEFLAVYLY
ncbi:META domain-containing protein [Marinobacter segnicrescens]|uniref:META domain-containing protein n=1 Tax=Marinobacter segnicrescens TaxID=430453 RepID=UPI003A933E2A